MTSRGPTFRWLVATMTGVTLLSGAFMGAFTGCFGGDAMAGGSSGVDNPEVRVAFVDAGGAPARVSGMLSLYLADQSPAIDPAPLLNKLLSGDSAAKLSALDFRLDSTRAYNLLLVSDDSTGSLLRGLVYDPSSRKFRLGGANASAVSLSLAPLMRYEGILEREDEELIRIIAPGTPFQAVVIDSVFVLEGVPANDSLVLHLLDHDGKEKPLKPAPAGGGGDRPRHRVDDDAPHVDRPSSPAPPHNMAVNAGPGRSAIMGQEFLLVGEVLGLKGSDARLAVRWRQVDPDPGLARAILESPSALQTRVSFPWPGLYRFVLTAAFGNHRSDDTVVVSVQPPPLAPVFTDPSPTNPHSLAAYTDGPWFRVGWYAYVPDTLSLQVSRDSGSTWQTLRQNMASYGPEEYWWDVSPPSSENCFLRLVRDGGVVAVSTRFAVRTGSGGH